MRHVCHRRLLQEGHRILAIKQNLAVNNTLFIKDVEFLTSFVNVFSFICQRLALKASESIDCLEEKKSYKDN